MEKDFDSVVANADGTYDVTYSINVTNTGGATGLYTLTDTPMFDDDVTINGGNYTGGLVCCGAFITPFTGDPGTLTLIAASSLDAGLTDVFTVTFNVTLDLDEESTDGGDNVYDSCTVPGNGPGSSPEEGLYNVANLDRNADGSFEVEDDACGDLPYIIMEKDFESVVANTDGTYTVSYTIAVENIGGAEGSYALTDNPSFDDDVTIVNGGFSSTLDCCPGIAGIFVGDPGNLVLTNNTPLAAGATDVYTVDFVVTLDLDEDSTEGGDNIYTSCGEADPDAGFDPEAALFNLAELDRNSDGTVEVQDTACADLPLIIMEKSFDSVTALPDGSYDVRYNIIVENIGGASGSYDLTDTPSFDDDVTITGGSYDGGLICCGAFINTFTGDPGTITLYEDANLVAGGTDVYGITFNVTLDLDEDSTDGGDNIYTSCGEADPDAGFDPEAALFNLAELDRNSDGTVEVQDTACADLPYIIIEKSVIGNATDNGNGTYGVSYSISVTNIGGAEGMYALTDDPSFDDDITIIAGGYDSVVDCCPSTAGSFIGDPGIIVLTSNTTLAEGATDVYTIDFLVSIDLGDDSTDGGDNVYNTCDTANPNDGTDPQVGLYNVADLDRGADGTFEMDDDACTDLPASVGDFVFIDENANGQQDLTDTPLSGVIVSLTNSNGTNVIDVTGNVVVDIVTDADGAYLFNNLPPGDYVVTFDNPNTAQVPTLDNVGDDVTDSDITSDDTAVEVTLMEAEDNLTIDAGYYGPASIGDFVWEDMNANGQQDIDEPGIEGVTVSLSDQNGDVVFDADGVSVAPVLTGPNGEYLFDNLVPGEYIVTFTQPNEFETTPSDQGDDTTDSDADEFNEQSDVITLTSLENNETIDAGYYKTASLGDYVWYDLNKNGIQDDRLDMGTVLGTELPVENIGVELFTSAGVSQGTTTTDDNGFYEFTGIVPGDYYVQFNNDDFPNAFYVVTLENQGIDDTVDSDVSRDGTYSTHVTNLESGENDPTLDLGIFRNESAILDPCICKNNGTNSDNAQFDEHIEIEATPGGVWRIIEQQGMYLLSSGAPPATPVLVPLLTVVPNDSPDGTSDLYIYDFIHIDSIGYSVTVTNGTDTLSISNKCFYPTLNYEVIDDEFCLFDPPVELESNPDLEGLPINGITSYVLVNNTTGVEMILDNEMLDPSLLELGEYSLIVEFEPEDPELCIDRYIQILNITLTDCLAEIGDTTWVDTNGNGLFDSNELGLAGVLVTLFDADGNPVLEDAYGDLFGDVETNEDGFYEFINLPPGDYRVQFGDVDSYVRTQQNAGDDSLDSDADVSTGLTDFYTLESEERDSTIDAGYYIPASLGNYVWFDENGNGLQDADEDGVNDVRVELYKVDDLATLIAFEMTAPKDNEDGYYLFVNLSPDDYVVKFVVPIGTVLTTSDVTGLNTDATDDNNDSDADVITGLSHVITLSSGEEDLRIDAGLYEPLSLGNFVWDDVNNNGVYDNAEEALSGVTISLYRDLNNDDTPDENTLRTDVTDVNGNYLFEDLAPGDYIVVVDPTNFDNVGALADYISSTGNDEVDNTAPDPDVLDDDNDDNGYDNGGNIGVISKTVTLSSQEEPVAEDGDANTNLTVDFGFFKPAAIGDYVWEDEDADGIQDFGESGINDITVILFDAATDVALATTTTMSNPEFPTEQGYYLFDNLTPGSYYVQFLAPDGYTTTLPGTTSDDRDSDANDTGNMGIDMSPVYNLSPGDRNLTVDAGYYLSAKVGDYVWLDTNGTLTNLQDDGDIGVNGITVNLLLANGTVVATQLTRNEAGQDGYYMFTGLAAGQYLIQFDIPATYSFVIPNQGPDDVDSDVVDFINKTTLAFIVSPGDCIEDVDAGLVFNVLPIELASFTAKYNDTKDVIDLDWETETEINSDRFEIERRHETESGFYFIGEKKAEGSSASRVEYHYADADIERNGDYFYRLKMIDLDGTYEYSEIRVATVERGVAVSTSIYPNPATRFINLDIESGDKVEVKATLLTDAGRLVRANAINQTIDAGISNLSIDLDDVPGGTYILRVEVGQEVSFFKILVVR